MSDPESKVTYDMAATGNKTIMPDTLLFASPTKTTHLKHVSIVSKIIKKEDKEVTKMIKGTFLCFNPRCSSVRNGRGASGRDRLSALSIAISGITVLLFQAMLFPYNPNISHFNTDFDTQLVTFCAGSGPQAES